MAAASRVETIKAEVANASEESVKEIMGLEDELADAMVAVAEAKNNQKWYQRLTGSQELNDAKAELQLLEDKLEAAKSSAHGVGSGAGVSSRRDRQADRNAASNKAGTGGGYKSG